nr:hypothetical protein [Tanacetum cinerariifolium]
KCISPKDNRNKDTPRRSVPVEADEEPTNYALMAYASSGSSSSLRSNNEVAPYFKACSKSYATLQTHYDNLTVEFRKSQLDVLSYKTGLKSVEARLVMYQQNENVFEEDINILKLDVILRDNAPTSSKNLSKLLASQVRDKISLGFDSQVFDCEELHSHESDDSVPKSPVNDSESIVHVVNIDSSSNKPSKDMSKTLRPDAPIIKDWISNSKDETEIESVPKQKEPSFVPTSKHVKTPRESVKNVELPK